MSAIKVSTVIDAPPTEVWPVVADIPSHVEWMRDAVAIRFLSPTTTGVGTTFDCDVKLGPIGLTDRMEITEWVEPEVIGVRHVGVVRGTGQFTVRPVGVLHTEFTWSEQLTFPWWMGGPIGALIAAPVLRAVWRRNLRSLKAIVEARADANRKRERDG